MAFVLPSSYIISKCFHQSHGTVMLPSHPEHCSAVPPLLIALKCFLFHPSSELLYPTHSTEHCTTFISSKHFRGSIQPVQLKCFLPTKALYCGDSTPRSRKVLPTHLNHCKTHTNLNTVVFPANTNHCTTILLFPAPQPPSLYTIPVQYNRTRVFQYSRAVPEYPSTSAGGDRLKVLKHSISGIWSSGTQPRVKTPRYKYTELPFLDIQIYLS